MKMHPMVLALLASQTTAFAATAPVKMEEGCENMIRASVAALGTDYLMPDENGSVTLTKEDLESVTISNVKVLSSSCLGPDDCDAKHPDAFTYGATIGRTGKVVVSYHRGHCSVSKLSL